MEIKWELTVDDFYEIEVLEEKYYSSDYITPPEEGYLWYVKRKNSVLTVMDQGKIIGCLCIVPIGNTIAEQIKAGTYNDSEMTYEDILDLDNTTKKEITLFLSCVVVEEAYRKTEALPLLFREYLQYFAMMEQKGFRFTDVVTDNVTESGDRFSKKLGFKQIAQSDHGSTVYQMNYDEFVKEIQKRYGKGE